MERWMDIKGFEGFYQISDRGMVKSLSRTVTRKGGRILVIKERLMCNISNNEGYYKIKICKDNIQVSTSIHRLVAQTFIPNPENKSQVNHINGIKSDNRVENLEWSTPKENTHHAKETGLLSIVPSKKMPCIQVSLDGFILSEFDSRAEASRSTGTNRRDISDCINKKLKRAGGYLWF